MKGAKERKEGQRRIERPDRYKVEENLGQVYNVKGKCCEVDGFFKLTQPSLDLKDNGQREFRKSSKFFGSCCHPTYFTGYFCPFLLVAICVILKSTDRTAREGTFLKKGGGIGTCHALFYQHKIRAGKKGGKKSTHGKKWAKLYQAHARTHVGDLLRPIHFFWAGGGGTRCPATNNGHSHPFFIRVSEKVFFLSLPLSSYTSISLDIRASEKGGCVLYCTVVLYCVL